MHADPRLRGVLTSTNQTPCSRGKRSADRTTPGCRWRSSCRRRTPGCGTATCCGRSQAHRQAVCRIATSQRRATHRDVKVARVASRPGRHPRRATTPDQVDLVNRSVSRVAPAQAVERHVAAAPSRSRRATATSRRHAGRPSSTGRWRGVHLQDYGKIGSQLYNAYTSPAMASIMASDFDRSDSGATDRAHAVPRLPREWPVFPADFGADQLARPRAVRARSSDDRPSRARVRAADAGNSRWPEARLPDIVADRHLPGVGHRRVGSGAGQYAVARRSSPDVRDRALRDPVAQDGRQAEVVDFVPGDWRSGADAAIVESGSAPTRRTRSRRCWSCTTRRRPASPLAIPPIRQAIDRAAHPALLMVDTISSLALDRLPAPSGASTSPSPARRKA